MKTRQSDLAVFGDRIAQHKREDPVTGVHPPNGRSLTGCLLFLLTTLMFPLTAHGADPWELIPVHAAAVIRLQTPEVTIQELSDFVDEVQPGFGALIQGQAGIDWVSHFQPDARRRGYVEGLVRGPVCSRRIEAK